MIEEDILRKTHDQRDILGIFPFYIYIEGNHITCISTKLQVQIEYKLTSYKKIWLSCLDDL